jgi:TetR/AcrR family transcriptional regulator, cholesterol catabolism regulator
MAEARPQATLSRDGSEPTLRSRILDRFVASMADRGYSETAFGDIAGELGISKGTIVHHFKTKDALLAEAGMAYIGRREQELAFILERLEDPYEQLVAVIITSTICHGHDRQASRAFGREFARYAEDERLEAVRTRRDRYTDRIVMLIERAVTAGGLRAVNPRLALLQIFGMCNWTWTWYRPEGSLPIDEIAQMHAHTLMAGLGEGHAADPVPAVAVDVACEAARVTST